MSRRYPHTWQGNRLMPADDGSGHAYQAVGDPIECMIQTISPYRAAQIGQAYGQAFKLYVPPGSDVKMGDKGTDQDGNTYKVGDVEPRNFGSSKIQHDLYTVTKDTND